MPAAPKERQHGLPGAVTDREAAPRRRAHSPEEPLSRQVINLIPSNDAAVRWASTLGLRDKSREKT